MFFYLLYVVCSPLIWIFICFSAIFSHKIRIRLTRQRTLWKNALRTTKERAGDRKIVVFHAASAGEFEQTKPLLRKMDRSRYFLFQTFFSPTIYSKTKECDLFDAVCYHPFDLPWSACLFFMRLKPDYYIVVRHDVWPHHIVCARLCGVKTALINGNLHEKSLRMHSALRAFNCWLFAKFDVIACGSPRLQKRFSAFIPSEKIAVTGDSRFDQVIQRKEHNPMNHFNAHIHKTGNTILGSIVKSDFPVIFQGLRNTFPHGDQSLSSAARRLIIVPHEVDEPTLKTIERRLEECGMHSKRFSSLGNTMDTMVILVDTVGILADLYAYAQLAYVGAGFGAGVHSVIEPAVYGCAVACGPAISLLDEAVGMHESGAGIIVHNGDDFARFLNLPDNNEKFEVLRKRAQAFIYTQGNASEKIIPAIFQA